MPFIGGNSYGSSTNNRVSSGFDRFSSTRKSSVYERPFKPSDSTVAALSSKYLALANNNSDSKSDLTSSYRSRNYGSSNYGDTPTPFGKTQTSASNGFATASNYNRSDGGNSSYKPASRSNSRSLYNEEPENRYSTSTPTLSRSYNGSNGTPRSYDNNDLSDRIAKTLAKHGVSERSSTPTAVDSPYNSLGRNGGAWRRRFESVEPQDHSNEPKVYVVTRATSPQSDKTKQVRTRIARTTDPTCLEPRRSRKPRTYEVAVQTDIVPEYGELKTLLKKPLPHKPITRTSSGFDYFARVKKSLEEAPNAFASTIKRQEEVQEEEEEETEDSYYKIQKAPMMQLLPGIRNSSKPPSENRSSFYENGSSVLSKEEEKIPDNEEDDEEESEYEEYEEEEEDYEEKADKILEGEDKDSNLDYIDGDAEEEIPILSPKSKRKNLLKSTYISGTVDIDILLAKETDPSNLIESEEEIERGAIEMRPILDFSSAKRSSVTEEAPWWINGNKQEPEFKTREVSLDDEEEEPPAQNDRSLQKDEEEDYEEEGEWEYYYTEEEEQTEEREPAIKSPEVLKKEDEERATWILQGLSRIIPIMPSKKATDCDTESEESDDDDEQELSDGNLNKAYDQEKRYREWLQESAELHEEIKLEDDDHNKESTIIEEPASISKAEKLAQKIKNANETELKRVLFSLKTFFQSDKDLVFEFVKADGLTILIETGDKGNEGPDEPSTQMQNLILRALGQIMLYVDGMNGVMENPKALQFLYKLTASLNPLVCKTGIKLLLVFVEYLETNCLLLLQAINDADKNLGRIPWSNIVTILRNEATDVDLFQYAITLINKTLYGIPDQEKFYDQTDFMEELGIESVYERISSKSNPAHKMMEQIQLYNVALKQEDGEPVTEEEISYIDEEASEMGLRSVLRTKFEGASSKNSVQRKSLRYKTHMISNTELDNNGDIESVAFRDVESILRKNGLPTSKSGVALNAMKLNGVLEKARSIFISKINKGETEDLTKDESMEEEEEEDEAEGEKQWQRILSDFKRPLIICDLDFTDLQDDYSPSTESKPLPGFNIPVPPPPPPPPPPMEGLEEGVLFPPPPPPPKMEVNGKDEETNKTKSSPLPNKTKKTVKLFWKEIKGNDSTSTQNSGGNKKPTVWDEKTNAGVVDTSMIEYLFEYRGKDLSAKDNKTLILNTSREIVVLDHKRSNSINIGMTKLPPPRIIRSAVIKMDSTIMNREGVEKLLTMLPSEDETERIQEAREAQPDIPLGTAEQFLLTLSSINGLEARLRLWSFKMEFEVIEKELCDPIMDLKCGIESLMKNETFRTILHILLLIGNFLNGSSCKGFHLDYLAKVPEVKDTIHKHSLLYHTTYWVLEAFPTCSDLYSEIGPLIRASRTDFSESERTLRRMESECKHAWDYLKVVSKSADPGETDQFAKFSEFLADAAERIILMSVVYKKVVKKYNYFLFWLGIPGFLWSDYPIHTTCKTLSEFALEFRTTRDRVIQTIQKKKAAREKKVQTKKLEKPREEASQQPNGPHHRPRKHREDSQHVALQQILGTDIDVTDNGTLRRKKKHHRSRRHQQDVKPMSEEGSEPIKKEKKSRRHRSSLMGEGTLPITEEMIKSFNPSNEMERGLLETLIMSPDTSSLKRNKERRKSKIERKASVDLKRSRTREISEL